jgi:hypothetical protein
MTTLMQEDDETEFFANEEDDEAIEAAEDDESFAGLPASLRRRLAPGRFSPAKGIRGGTAHTPNGAVQIRLPTQVVTRAEFMRLRAEVQREARRTAAVLALQARRAAWQARQSRQYQQLAAVAALAVPPREIASLTIDNEQRTVTKTVYKPNMLATLAPVAPALLTTLLAGKDEGSGKPGGSGGVDTNLLLVLGAAALVVHQINQQHQGS